MENLGVSAIHPPAPEVLSAVALFSAPIDIDAALARLKELWSMEIEPQWQHVDADPSNPKLVPGDLVHFTDQGVQVMLSPLNYPLDFDGGALPQHVFHVPVTLYAPAEDAAHGVLAGERTNSLEAPELKRRKRMVSAHILLTQVMDALMREDAAVGVFRAELGIVQPPQMVVTMAEQLTRGEAPLPLWVNIRTVKPDLTVGRTLGLPLFGHLDLEIRESVKAEDDVYSMLASIANYIITGDTYLLPGQTLGSSDGEKLAITQDLSPFDKSPVIRVMYS
ncbi:hypothetical protein JOD55_000313 [Arcanobacterium pluranimalium]|uniref:DUF4261 domain-containing protein n=1 Tax=Arcanobacterium pluranimalium TaxID=108028 RepID=UPI0019571028|nr:DUF4261 domain-containing protein [Arcanobacterium pluranimalium]MBM7824486.1 hypothetical protein [Arcanobacterium pluranimalium]